MSKDFDLVILGVGMAGVNAANKCASAGWKVAVVDALPYGGTCALRGCDPKKMLRRAAEVIDAARLMRGKGIEDTDLTINWPAAPGRRPRLSNPALHGWPRADLLNESAFDPKRSLSRSSKNLRQVSVSCEI